MGVEFVKSFFCIYWDDHMVLCFNLLIALIDLGILKHPCNLGINLNWSWCINLLMYCWIWCTNFSWGFLGLCLSVILVFNFLFYVLSLTGFGIRMMAASQNEMRSVPSSAFFGRVSEGVNPSLMFDRIHLWSHLALEFYLLKVF